MSAQSEPVAESGDERQPSSAEMPAGSSEGPDDKRLPPNPDPTAHLATESLVRSYEVQEFSLRPIVIFGIGLALVAVIIHIGLWWFVGAQTDQTLEAAIQISPAMVTPPIGTGPGIEAAPEQGRAEGLAPAYARINSYGWVDQAAGTVHIPIEQAMDLLVQQGLPSSAAGAAPTFGLDPAYSTDSASGRTLPAAPGAE